MFTKRLLRQHGLTLIELILAMVIMGAAAAGILGVLNLSSSHSADPVRRKQALLIAQAYLEEVESARFTYCDPSDPSASTATSVASCTVSLEKIGPETGNNRPYDNINDYVTSNYVPGISAPQQTFGLVNNLTDANLAALGNGSPLVNFTATIALNSVPALGPALGVISSNLNDATGAQMTAIQITVTVAYGTGANDFVTLDGYRTRYAPTAVP